MTKGKVLITDKAHPLLGAGLASRGWTIDEQPEISMAEVRAGIGSYNGLIINSKIQVDEALLAAAPDLQFVGRLGSGMEIIDQDAAARHGVAVFSAPEGNCNAVAEHALGMLLCLANNLLRADREVRQFQWHREANRGWELGGRTLGIVGMGHTGSAFARKLQGLGLRIIGYDKYRQDWMGALPWVEAVPLETMQREADILSLHLPLTAETRNFVDKAFLNTCRPGLVLVNTARGNQVVLADLLDALATGRVAGVCMDVFPNEKVETMDEGERAAYATLYASDRVVLSPHIAGWTRESLEGIARTLLDKICAWEDKKRSLGPDET